MEERLAGRQAAGNKLAECFSPMIELNMTVFESLTIPRPDVAGRFRK